MRLVLTGRTLSFARGAAGHWLGVRGTFLLAARPAWW
jgi:hypothetical protein